MSVLEILERLAAVFLPPRPEMGDPDAEGPPSRSGGTGAHEATHLSGRRGSDSPPLPPDDRTPLGYMSVLPASWGVTFLIGAAR